MPRDSIDLHKSSGNLGVAGETFRGHVLGAADGVEMIDYLLNGVSWSGNPTNPLPVYADNTLFTINAAFTRGAEFYRIQRNTVAGWAVSVIVVATSADVPGSAIDSVTALGAPAGASHDVGVRVRGVATTGSVSISAVQRAQDEPADPFFGAWPVYFNSWNAGAPTGNTLVRMILEYFPDSGPFNDYITQSWDFYIDNRAGELDTEWHSNATYTALVTTANNFLLAPSALYPTNENGLLPGESITLYLRYKSKGTSTWTNHGAVTCLDGR